MTSARLTAKSSERRSWRSLLAFYNLDRYGYSNPIFIESLEYTPRFDSMGYAIMGLRKLLVFFKWASSWAGNMYTKNEDPMGHILVTCNIRRLDEIHHSLEAATRKIPALINATGEITATRWMRWWEYLIFVSHNATIATIMTMPVNRTLT
jgi:hypothetical protein